MSYTAGSFVFGQQPTAAQWNVLWTNDASFNDGTGIADSAILPKHLRTGTGSTWAWTSYTPTLANLTLGNGTLAASYIQQGKLVIGNFRFLLGTTSAVASNPTFTLPVTAASRYSTPSHSNIGTGFIVDEGASVYLASADLAASTSVVSMMAWFAGGSFSSFSTLTATVPFTFGSTDYINIKFEYEAA